jgi:Mn-dependent DtxR family transcriptional regulator
MAHRFNISDETMKDIYSELCNDGFIDYDIEKEIFLWDDEDDE